MPDFLGAVMGGFDSRTIGRILIEQQGSVHVVEVAQQDQGDQERGNHEADSVPCKLQVTMSIFKS